MTMQTNSLPIQLTAPAAPVPGARNNAPGNTDGVNFSAALTQQIAQRQVEQRQLEQRQSPVAPQPQAATAQQSAPAPKQAAARAPANEAKAAPRETAGQAAREPGRPAGKEETTVDQAAPADAGTTLATGDGGEDAAASADARAADAVVDMLALVASFHQVQQAEAPVAQGAPAARAPAVQPDTLLAGMPGKPAGGAEPLVRPEGAATLASVIPGTGAPQDKAQAGIDLRALDTGSAAEAAKLPAQSTDFAAALHESTTRAAGMTETAPGNEALTSLAAQATALQSAQAAGSVPTDRLSARVGTPAWDNQVGQKVIWMVGGEDQSATLELNPPDLGPVQVVLNVSNDLASVTFSSQQLEVRQALENALPRLREMMNESGIALGNATVDDGAASRQGQDGQPSGRPGRGSAGNGANGQGDSALAEAAPRRRTSMLGGAGAVDTFA